MCGFVGLFNCFYRFPFVLAGARFFAEVKQKGTELATRVGMGGFLIAAALVAAFYLFGRRSRGGGGSGDGTNVQGGGDCAGPSSVARCFSMAAKEGLVACHILFTYMFSGPAVLTSVRGTCLVLIAASPPPRGEAGNNRRRTGRVSITSLILFTH